MYSNKFVVSIIVGGNVVEELANGNVVLPFGCEYAIRLRNRHDRTAVAKVKIDGEDVSGGGFVVGSDSYVDILRPVSKDAAFKFVSTESDAAAAAKKDGPNTDGTKGLVEVSWYLSYVSAPITYTWTYSPWYYKYPSGSDWWGGNCWGFGGSTYTLGACTLGSGSTASESVYCCSSTGGQQSGVAPSDGCTVGGGCTGQSFSSSWLNIDWSNATTMRLVLRGYAGGCCAPQSPKENKAPKCDSKAEALERENESLRLKAAMMENEALKKRIRELEGK